MFDTLLKNVSVIDGTGREPFSADIGILGSKIGAIGVFEDSTAGEVLELDGRFLSPGFIDIHSHSDFSLLVDPRALTSIMQGVTTIVIGNCGYGCAPVNNRDLIRWNILGYTPRWGVEVDFPAFGDYLHFLEERGLVPNVFPLVSHGALRLAILGLEERVADHDEIKAMRDLLAKCLQDGAKGLSSGLEYSPGAAANLEELQSLVEEIGAGFYSTHVRSRNSSKLAQSVNEAISTVKGTPAHLQISHLAPRSDTSVEGFEKVLKTVETAIGEGIDVGYDTLVYEWGPHQLADLLPTSVRLRKLEDISRFLTTPECRRLIWESKRSSVQQLLEARRAQSIILAYAPQSQSFIGKSFLEIAGKTGRTPFDSALEILAREGEEFMAVSLRTPFTSQDLLYRLFVDDRCIPMSDGVDVGKDGPMQGYEFSRSSYGWLASFIQQTVYDKKLLSLEEAVQRVTSLPARYLSLMNRGVIREGAFADLVVFDPENFMDRSCFNGCPNYPSGVEYVFVNGAKVVEKGRETGCRAGLLL